MRAFLAIILLIPFLVGFTSFDIESNSEIILESNTLYSFTFTSYYRNLAEIAILLEGDCSNVSASLYSNNRLIAQTNSSVFNLNLPDSKRKTYKIILNSSSPDDVKVSYFSNEEIVHAYSYDDVMKVEITKQMTGCRLAIFNKNLTVVRNIGTLTRHYPETPYPVIYISPDFPENAIPAIGVSHNLSKSELFIDHITFYKWAEYPFREWYETNKFNIAIYIALLLFVSLSWVYVGAKKSSKIFLILIPIYLIFYLIFSLFLQLSKFSFIPLVILGILFYFLTHYKEIKRLLLR